MNCRHVVNLLSAYVDGELTGTEMLEIRRHVSTCSECADEYQAVLFTKRAVSRLETVAPREDFMVKLMASLDEVQVTPYQRAINNIARLFHKRFNPAAAALTASGLAIVIMSANGMMGGFVNQSSQMSAIPMGASVARASFVPEVHTGTNYIETSRPLTVASESGLLNGAHIEFVAYGGPR